MSSFNARLRLPGQSRIPLGVEVDVTDERITLTSGEREVAKWSLEKIDVSHLSDGFHITVDGEEVVLSVVEPARFASELGVVAPAPTPRARPVSAPKRSGWDDDLRMRIGRIAEALTADSVAPETAFAEWLGLLKELNSRHARGAMPTPLFHELNTCLLDLIPGGDPVRS